MFLRPGTSLQALYAAMGVPERTPRGKPNGGRPPKYVKFSGKDKGEGLLPVFFEDPRTFQPTPGQKEQIHAWGLYPYCDAEDLENLPNYDGPAIMFRQMNYQLIYFGGNPPSPERQFIDITMDRKRKQLEKVDLKGMEERDVILRIHLIDVKSADGRPRVWRTFRVSAGMKLSVFQDKIVCPIMGWLRNYHCYTFTDYRDGALFGPITSGAIDRAHSAQIGYDYLSDDKYTIAHLFEKEGDEFGYLYDFGDKWHHEIKVEKILNLDESNGRVEILNGAGICPGEDMKGNWQWEAALKVLDEGSREVKRQKIQEILACANYKDYPKSATIFNYDIYDKVLAETRLNTALSSFNSVKSGSKKVHVPMFPGAEETLRGLDEVWKRKGQTVKQRAEPESGGFWQETVSEARDKKSEGACAACGNPAGATLKACSACKKVLYCSTECQKRHWKLIHKRQCVPAAKAGTEPKPPVSFRPAANYKTLDALD